MPVDGALPIVYSPAYEVDIGAHVFPTRKYRLVLERLVGEGVVSEDQVLEPEPASRDSLSRVHTAEYLDKLYDGGFSAEEILTQELPYSAESRHGWMLMTGGTMRATAEALRIGVAVHLGGGFHHAYPAHGEGFCLINDVGVAARDVLAAGLARRVVVVDLDVHHGNGTAAAMAQDPSVFTFSMHQEWNYPAVKPPSDLDIGLEDGTGDDEYLALLAGGLEKALDGPGCDLVVYLAGADPYVGDQLGGLALTREGLRARDRMVFEAAESSGCAIAVTLAGGYARNTEDTVAIHCATVAEAADSLRRRGERQPGAIPFT